MLSKPQTAFVTPLLSASMMLERRLDAFIKESTSLGLSQFKIMICISRQAKLPKVKSACSQTIIANIWGVSEAAISRQMGPLEKARLITKSLDPNEKRKVMLSLTKKGKIYVGKTLRMIDKELMRIFRPISMSTKKQLATQLGKVLDSLSNI